MRTLNTIMVYSIKRNKTKKKSQHTLKDVKVDRERITKAARVKKEVFEYYEKKFKKKLILFLCFIGALDLESWIVMQCWSLRSWFLWMK